LIFLFRSFTLSLSPSPSLPLWPRFRLHFPLFLSEKSQDSEEGGRRKEEGGRRKEEGGRRKRGGGRKKEEG
jgi:hypothetical protein